MSKVVAAVQSFALTLGAPGLFLVALLDSSLLSLPQVPDLLLIFMVTRHPSLWLALRAHDHGRVHRRVRRHVPARAQGRRARAAQDGERRTHGARARHVPEVGAPRGPRALHPAAAGALQGVRPARRGGADSVVAVRGRHRARPRLPVRAGGPAGALVRTAGDDVPRREPAAGFARAGSRPGTRREWPTRCSGNAGRSMPVRYNPAFS